MKKKLLIVLLLTVFIFTGCSNNKQEINKNNKESNEKARDEFVSKIEIIINEKTYNATLEDNETTRKFISLLPIQFNMNELNGNEKYIYIDTSLPINSSNPRHINAGDIMLYGNNCLVIFYKSFDTSYNYTKIGHIDNLDDLGKDNVVVNFQK